VRAVAAHYAHVQEREGGSDDPQLVPLVACLIELLPWLKQWHNEIDPDFNMGMGDYSEGFVQNEARQKNKTVTRSVPGSHPPGRPLGGADGPPNRRGETCRERNRNWNRPRSRPRRP
jgi:hypothetical protein